MIMENLVAQVLAKFERGQITRRELVETLAFAATAIYGVRKGTASVEAAVAPPAVASGRGTLRTLLVNHISYACPDYRPARDFYMEVMGMEHVGEVDDKGRQATLTIGSRGTTPLNSPKGTPVPFLIIRNGRGTQE